MMNEDIFLLYYAPNNHDKPCTVSTVSTMQRSHSFWPKFQFLWHIITLAFWDWYHWCKILTWDFLLCNSHWKWIRGNSTHHFFTLSYIATQLQLAKTKKAQLLCYLLSSQLIPSNNDLHFSILTVIWKVRHSIASCEKWVS